MKENLDKEVWLDLGRIYLGTVKDLVHMPKAQWDKERWRIWQGSGIEVMGADHQYSKLAFTSHIDKLKGIDRSQND